MIPLDKGISNAGTPVCDIDFGLSRMIQVNETSLFAVVYQSPWHPKNGQLDLGSLC